jgi:Spy/CpxP family protein refolding chaperone
VPRRAPRALAAAVLGLVAAAGVLSGIALDRTVLRPRHLRPPPSFGGRGGPNANERRRMGDELARELKLTPAQRARVDSIMDRRFTGLRAATDAVRPRVDAIVESTQTELERTLSPEQLAKFRELRARHGPRRPPR